MLLESVHTYSLQEGWLLSGRLGRRGREHARHILEGLRRQGDGWVILGLVHQVQKEIDLQLRLLDDAALPRCARADSALDAMGPDQQRMFSSRVCVALDDRSPVCTVVYKCSMLTVITLGHILQRYSEVRDLYLRQRI